MILRRLTAAAWVLSVLSASAYAQTTIDVEVQLSGPVVDGPLERCICFDLYTDCTGTCPTRVCEAMTFGHPDNFPGTAQAQIQVEGGPYFCIDAVDPWHTLRSTDPTFDGTTATFDGDPALGGNGLTSGNLNGDAVIDISDYEVFALEQGTNYGTGDTACTQGFPHADLNGDGIVDDTDNAIITANTGALGTGCCGGSPAGPDGDGVTDACDNCPNDFNPGQEDSDGNGIGDACEAAVPAVSEWGLIVMMLLLVTTGSLAIPRSRNPRLYPSGTVTSRRPELSRKVS